MNRSGTKRTRDQRDAKDTRSKQPKRASNTNSGKNDQSVSSIRKRIRDTERLLKRPSITADVKVGMERRLKALHMQLSEGEHQQLEKRRTGKYKMVRFIEEQKVRRKMQKLEKQLAAADADQLTAKARKQYEERQHELEVDLNYIKYFPKSEKYIGLFAAGTNEDGSSAGDHATARRRNELRERIRTAMESGQLAELESIAGQPTTTTAVSKQRRPSADQDVEMEDDFFASASDSE